MIHGWFWLLIFIVLVPLTLFVVDFLEENEEPDVCVWCGGLLEWDNWKRGGFCTQCGKEEENVKY
jgi:hypothetical protein